MKKRVMTLFLLGVLGVGLSGCVVLDRHGRVNSRATAVANGLLIGAGVIGLGIAAHEADVHETRVRPSTGAICSTTPGSALDTSRQPLAAASTSTNGSPS